MCNLLERARVLHQRGGDRRALIFTLNNLGDCYHEMQQLDKAEAVFREAEQICNEINAPNPCALLAFNFAELLLQTDRPEQALPKIEISESFYGAEDTDLLYTRALYWAQSDDLERGKEYLQRAVAGSDPERGAGYSKVFGELLEKIR